MSMDVIRFLFGLLLGKYSNSKGIKMKTNLDSMYETSREYNDLVNFYIDSGLTYHESKLRATIDFNAAFEVK